jgi:hypothetical protein
VTSGEDPNNVTKGHSGAKRRRAPKKPTKPKPAPVEFIRPELQEIWDRALELANNDPKRCVTQSDGSVIVYNNPVRK